jgi:hypothetical protein
VSISNVTARIKTKQRGALENQPAFRLPGDHDPDAAPAAFKLSGPPHMFVALIGVRLHWQRKAVTLPVLVELEPYQIS